MKARRIGSFFMAFVLSVASLTVFMQGTAYAANRSWTGGGGDSNFNTAANWSGGVVPTTGDNLTFDVSTLSANAALNNNISSLSLGSLTFTGTSASGYRFTLSGQALTLTGGVTSSASTFTTLDLDLTLGASQAFAFSGDGGLRIGSPLSIGTRTLALGANNLTLTVPEGCDGISISHVITGSGSITKGGAGQGALNAASPAFSGAITASAGRLAANNAQALGAASAGTTISSGATLLLGIEADATFAEPLTTSGSGVGGYGALIVTTPNTFASSCSGGGESGSFTATLSGGLTLQANTVYGGGYNANVTGTYTSNGHTLSVASGGIGSITTSAGTVSAPSETVTVAAGDNQPSTFVSIGNNQTYIINGIRGGVAVASGGTLKGTGQVGDTTVNAGGVIAPGESPGCLATGNLSLAGTYQFELGGGTPCTGYDQIQVTGTVTIDPAALLQTSLYGNFAPVKDQVFTIISNDSNDIVGGTFLGLAEGATFALNDYVFRISYVGGDGNDVTLTALNVPATPNTGFALLSSNPVLMFVGTTVCAAMLLLIGRRLRYTRR